jgi:hypothetical protein
MTDTGLPIEDFIQAITSQLDRTQEALALKADAGLPLTFAVRDLSLDLRTHVDFSGSVVRIRPAGPADSDASTLRLSLSTITRPMIEENTRPVSDATQETSLREALGDDLTDEEERRLEWAGVRSVEQLRSLRAGRAEAALNRTTRLPVQRLWSRLQAASQPQIHDLRPLPGAGPHEPREWVATGRNLLGTHGPDVRLGGESVDVVDARPDRLRLRVLPQQLGSTLEITTEDGIAAVALVAPPPSQPHAPEPPAPTPRTEP